MIKVTMNEQRLQLFEIHRWAQCDINSKIQSTYNRDIGNYAMWTVTFPQLKKHIEINYPCCIIHLLTYCGFIIYDLLLYISLIVIINLLLIHVV